MLLNWGVGEDSWESLAHKEIKPINLKGNQSWIFIGRAGAEAEVPVLQPSDAKSQLIGKDLDAGKDWRQEKRMAEDEMVEWHHWLNGHEFEQIQGDSEGQWSLECGSSWDCKKSETTKRLNNNCILSNQSWEVLINGIFSLTDASQGLEKYSSW